MQFTSSAVRCSVFSLLCFLLYDDNRFLWTVRPFVHWLTLQLLRTCLWGYRLPYYYHRRRVALSSSPSSAPSSLSLPAWLEISLKYSPHVGPLYDVAAWLYAIEAFPAVGKEVMKAASMNSIPNPYLSSKASVTRPDNYDFFNVWA